MKSYEILPAGMTGSAMGRAAKAPKSYEILPGAGTAEQGLVGWTKGASAIAQGVSTYGATSNQGIGLPYDPARAMPMHGGATVPRMERQQKAYEILPGTGTEEQGLGGKNVGSGAGCGCDQSGDKTLLDRPLSEVDPVLIGRPPGLSDLLFGRQPINLMSAHGSGGTFRFPFGETHVAPGDCPGLRADRANTRYGLEVLQARERSVAARLRDLRDPAINRLVVCEQERLQAQAMNDRATEALLSGDPAAGELSILAQAVAVAASQCSGLPMPEFEPIRQRRELEAMNEQVTLLLMIGQYMSKLNQLEYLLTSCIGT